MTHLLPSTFPLPTGGISEFSDLSLPYTTMLQDRLASCLLYPTGASAVTGDLLLQESAIGDPPSTLTGTLRDLPGVPCSLLYSIAGRVVTIIFVAGEYACSDVCVSSVLFRALRSCENTFDFMGQSVAVMPLFSSITSVAVLRAFLWFY